MYHLVIESEVDSKMEPWIDYENVIEESFETIDNGIVEENEKPVENQPVLVEEKNEKVKSSQRARKFNVLENDGNRRGGQFENEVLKKDLKFMTGNPVVGTTRGIIHLFNERKKNIRKSKIICIVAVPNWLSLSDLIDLIGKETVNKTDSMRVLSDDSPNKYMFVIKFKDQASSDLFFNTFNGKPFSSMSESSNAELCRLGYVKTVEFIKPVGKAKQDKISCSTSNLFPNTNQDSFLVEIPTCPVCLERLDSTISGLLTIMCQHTFHCDCLIRWKEDNTCPVCRYIQQPANNQSLCTKCGTQEKLWICLICGHVGCSRYQESHAQRHFIETNHNYSLEIETQRVWDYAGDNYVHRLIQNKTDGKLVELPPPEQLNDQSTSKIIDTNQSKPSANDLDKIELISLEYQYLMTAQLETQKNWFELKNKEHELILSQQIKELEDKQIQYKKQISKLQDVLKILQAERDNALLQNLEKDKIIADLQEQIRDLMLFLDARKVIQKEGELVDGQVLTLSNPQPKIVNTSKTNVISPVRDSLRKKIAQKSKNSSKS